ncbi:MAG: sigma-70 family RNA polymerase sigma factor [Bacteroidia bacterium]|nr:sigma-70 family RNA polymerase sigma factor [Bacteroidia bacterium]
MKEQHDEEIIAGILAGGKDREKTITKLYKEYFHLTRTGKKLFRQLSREDLTDAYTSAILSLINEVINHRFRGDSSLWTFLFRIFKNKCVDILRKNSSNPENHPEIPEYENEPGNIFRGMEIKETFDRMLIVLDELGEPCKQIILDSEYFGYNAEEIAQRIGFKNARSVSSKKYTCLQQLREMLNNRNF